MRRQAEAAIELSDVIIFMVDAKEGMTAGDKDIAAMLMRVDKPVILAVNKVDNVGEPPADVYEFYNLGIGEFMTLSAAHGLGIGELLDAVYEKFPEQTEEPEEPDVIKVAIVGKPNAGKSSLVNKILGELRVIVSDVPGTTRDAIDTYATIGAQKYCFIDTAGMRKRGKITDNIERYSIMRSLGAVDRSDVVIIMIDAKDGVTEQDTKIAGYAHDQGKACIIAVNKWDLIEKETGTLEKYKTDVYNSFNFMMYAPVVFISALTGKRVPSIFDTINFVNEEAAKRISTGMLNDVLTRRLRLFSRRLTRVGALRFFI